MKKSLVLKYPTLWNMRKFVIFGIILSIIFNISIAFLFLIGLLYILPSLLILGVIFIPIINSDSDINSYDIFDKNKIHPYKEYFIYFLIVLSFFISATLLSSYIKNSYNTMDKSKEILFLSTNDINITNLYFEKNTFVYKKNFNDKNERNITKKEKKILETLNIKNKHDLNKIKSVFVMNEYFNFYSFFLSLLFVPLILLIRIKPKYLSLEMVIYIFIFIIVGGIFFSEVEKKEFILNSYDFIFKKHYLITFFITIWIVFWCGINFTKYKMQNYFLEKPTNDCNFLFIFSLMILFIILNFSFKLNLWVSSLIIFAIILLFIYPLKQLSVISSFYEDEEKKDK